MTTQHWTPHPHDGYAYDGCKCVCCTNVRALAVLPPDTREERKTLFPPLPEVPPGAWEERLDDWPDLLPPDTREEGLREAIEHLTVGCLGTHEPFHSGCMPSCHRFDRDAMRAALASTPRPGLDEELAAAKATIEAMSGDAADLHDLIGEAAAMRTVLSHLLGDDRGRIHDSGCGICDAGRALLTADHELPSFAANLAARQAEPPETP